MVMIHLDSWLNLDILMLTSMCILMGKRSSSLICPTQVNG